jgi:hypothetical protein
VSVLCTVDSGLAIHQQSLPCCTASSRILTLLSVATTYRIAADYIAEKPAAITCGAAKMNRLIVPKPSKYSIWNAE